MAQPVTYSFNSKTDFDGKRGYAVYVNTDTSVGNLPVVQLATAAEQKQIGLIKDEGSGVGTKCTVVVDGRCEYAVAGGTITKGASVTADANGKLVDAAAGETAIAIALEAAVADGKFPVLVKKHSVPA